ncbi:OmpA family protein [Aquisalimonas asiatica]|uniref:Outer membrane protein OmpA n=1 Tax=Aquisalimonas asiatica TaxID=406100 RepID=A0A1H8UMP2_9GAMM|nr:OmpA family protein [Aquisalimonas asiatica]SEP04479.1 Outer membrane protein OmpA [Aquisalimonas asiatica]
MRHLLVFTGLMLGGVGLVHGAEDRRLAAAVAEQYQPCGDTAALVLPLARSGLDLVPLYANGYQLETADGSPFAEQDLDVLLREPAGLQSQLEAYLACETPIMRLTQAQALLVAKATEANAGSAMTAFYQHGWSVGAHELRAASGVEELTGLNQGTVAVGPNGGGLDLLAEATRVARERAGSDWAQSPSVVLTDDASGTGGDTPEQRLAEDDRLTAALVATDAPGEHAVLLSSQSASRAVSSVYVVRRDFLDAHREQVEGLVTALFNAEEQVREDVTTQIVDWNAVAGHLLGDSDAHEQARRMWSDVETVGVQGNVDWSGDTGLRSFHRLNGEIAGALRAMGVLSATPTLALADMSYSNLADGVFDQRRAELSSFDPDAARTLLSEQRDGGDIDGRTILRFEIRFQPNQDQFPASEYADDFADVLDAAQRYRGALLTVEGHADPSLYVQRRSWGASEDLLAQQRDNLAELSEARAESVRQSVLAFASEHSVRLDSSQLITEGLGISDPATGLCDDVPCPVAGDEQAENRRVVFRVVEIEAESDAFTPPTTW